jgi:hypothetical protein
MAALRAQLDEKQKELDTLQEAAMLGQAEIEVDEEEWVAYQKATAVRRLSDMQLHDTGNNVSGSNGELKNTGMDSGGESDNMETDNSESDVPMPKAKKAPQKGVSLAFNQLQVMLLKPFTSFDRPKRKAEEMTFGKPQRQPKPRCERRGVQRSKHSPKIMRVSDI